MKTSKEYRAREIMNDIHDVLWNERDPIDVKGEAPEDEYDSYIGGIYRLLANRADEDSLIDHLSYIETESMGLTQRNREGLRPIVKKLLGIAIEL